jgi:hypothetical protein
MEKNLTEEWIDTPKYLGLAPPPLNSTVNKGKANSRTN